MADEYWKERLDRIEDKMDKMADAMVALARFEEKVHGIQEFREQSHKRMNHFDNKLDTIEKLGEENANTVSVINKLFWIIVAVGSSAIAAQIWM